MAKDFSDFYILYEGHPLYEDKIIEDEVMRGILQKWENIIFTNQGDLFFDPNFGGNLEYYLHETILSGDTIEGYLQEQIDEYIPELDDNDIPYTLSVDFYEDTDSFQDYMVVSFTISDYNAVATIL